MIGKVDPSSSDNFSVDSILDIVLDLPVRTLDLELVIVGLVAVCFVDVELVAVNLETASDPVAVGQKNEYQQCEMCFHLCIPGLPLSKDR